MAAKTCVRRLLGADVDAGHVRITRDRRGAPWASVDGRRIPVSLAHAQGWAAAAGHPQTRVGVDIEPSQELPASFARYFLSREEMSALEGWTDRPTSLLVAWTIKEAVLKATGRGLSVPPSMVRIRSMGPDGRVSATLNRSEMGVACWREEGVVVSVACAGTRDLPELSISRGAM